MNLNKKYKAETMNANKISILYLDKSFSSNIRKGCVHVYLYLCSVGTPGCKIINLNALQDGLYKH